MTGNPEPRTTEDPDPDEVKRHLEEQHRTMNRGAGDDKPSVVTGTGADQEDEDAAS